MQHLPSCRLTIATFFLLASSAFARIDTAHQELTLDGKRYVLIIALERDDQTGEVLRYEQQLVLLDDEPDIDLPRVLEAPSLRQPQSSLVPTLADIDSRMPAGHPYRANDPWTWGHETTHGINSRLRNEYMREHGGRVNAMYLPGGKAIYAREPQTTIGRVAQLVPRSLRGMRYNLYLVQQRRDWDNEPLYLLDEWVAYINGAQVFLECDERTRQGWIVTPGAIEFATYGTCVAWASKSDDEQLKRTLALFWKLSLDVYEKEQRPESHSFLVSLRSDPDAEEFRRFCRSYFGETWADKYLFKTLSPARQVQPGGRHWLPPRHGKGYYKQQENPQRGYPIRGSWWTFPGNTREDLIRHLQVGEHAGKFDVKWLNTLSWEQLNSLHSDDHEGRTQTRVTPQMRTSYLPQPVQIFQHQAMGAAFCPT